MRDLAISLGTVSASRDPPTYSLRRAAVVKKHVKELRKSYKSNDALGKIVPRSMKPSMWQVREMCFSPASVLGHPGSIVTPCGSILAYKDKTLFLMSLQDVHKSNKTFPGTTKEQLVTHEASSINDQRNASGLEARRRSLC